jgi:hypothetical protein
MPSLDDEDGYALKQDGPTIPPVIQSVRWQAQSAGP